MSRPHLDEIGGIIGVRGAEMEKELQELMAEHGPHSFIYWPKGALQEPVSWAPLPEWLRSSNIVQRRLRHARER